MSLFERRRTVLLNKTRRKLVFRMTSIGADTPHSILLIAGTCRGKASSRLSSRSTRTYRRVGLRFCLDNSSAHTHFTLQIIHLIRSPGTVRCPDRQERMFLVFSRLGPFLTHFTASQVVDSTLVEWILPDFTTTTWHDRTIGSMVMMSTLKA